MTRDHAFQTARAVAQRAGWPWAGPIHVEQERRFSVFGRLSWRVTTNTEYAEIGNNVHVHIDDETGRVLSSDYTPARTFNPTTTP